MTSRTDIDTYTLLNPSLQLKMHTLASRHFQPP